MLQRKIQKRIEEYFNSNSNKIMIIDGARQIGKSYIIRHVGSSMFENYIEINLLEDYLNKQSFSNVKNVQDFYLQVSMIAGEKMKEKENTLIFLDEIQAYPHLLTLLKFLKADDKFRYICSGSLLGVTLHTTTSIPIGSIEIVRMYPLDFEEFLYAYGFNDYAINNLKNKYLNRESLDVATHNKLLDLFKKYIIVGGLPDAVNNFLESFNIVTTRKIHEDIYSFYKADATKYDFDNKLKIMRIYDLMPSNLENKKKRIIIKDIEGITGKRFVNYVNEFDYLIHSGIALETKAVSTPTFPLISNSTKNLIKLYFNDLGILSNILFKYNINAILNDELSVNLGSVYENAVAIELKAHSHELYYYDNKHNGEVDFLIDDYDSLSCLPIEVKSGRDYTIHSALDKFVNNKDYNIKSGIVLSNAREIYVKNKILYLPIYFIMFI